MRQLFVAAILVSMPMLVDAHEIGTTQVNVAIHGSAFVIDVTVDPDSVLTKLQVFSGETASPGRDRLDRDARILASAAVFLDRFAIRFDGAIARPDFAYLPASAIGDLAQSPSRVRLTGRVPTGASAMTLANGLALGSYAVNIRIGDGEPQTVWVDGTGETAAIPLAVRPPLGAMDVARQYFVLGYTHIVPKGTDHILFVLGIFLLSVRWRSILLQVSTFTLAHSITLGLTMYGIVSLPAKVVEPMIALSIAYVAIENLLTSELKSWRLALVFGFGLLHGMGFAGVLRDLGLPRSQFLTALITFNGGVEAGQLTVIAMAFLAVAYWRDNRTHYRHFVVQPASLVIALIGLYWTVQRLAM